MSLSCLGIRLELKRLGISQYHSFNFNSMCVFNGVPLGANENGIFSLDGDTDNGEEIDSTIELPLSDFGSSRSKRLRRVFVGYEAEGSLDLSVATDEVDEHTETLTATAANQHGSYVSIPRSLKGRYWSVKIGNQDGCDFSIDEISILPIVLSRR